MNSKNFENIAKITFAVLLAASLLACSKEQTGSSDLSAQVDQAEGIVNGKAVTALDIYGKSTIALYVNLPGRDGQNHFMNFCTGTIISKNLVLTAAHCFADFAQELGATVEQLRPFVKVGFGLQVAKSLDDKTVEFRNVAKIQVHEKYKVDSVQTADEEPMYDIAMIRIEGEIPASAVTASIPTDSKFLKKGKNVTLVGFGLTDGVMQVSATSMNRVDVKVDDPNFSSTQFTYAVKDGKSACSGDSGGPAYIRSGSRVFVVGVTSWGDRFCKQIGAYTSVAAMSSWVLETAKAILQ